jgi:hypothetical protein
MPGQPMQEQGIWPDASEVSTRKQSFVALNKRPAIHLSFLSPSSK